MKKFLLSLAVCVAATSGLYAQDTAFDGTLDCNGNRYMSIPQSDAFNVSAGTGEITVTARIWIRDNYYGKPRGIICSRYHEESIGGAAGTWYKECGGFDIHGGESAANCLGNNVTVDGSYFYKFPTYNLGYLNHTYNDTKNGLSVGKWAHIAWTFKSNGGISAIYIDGILQGQEVTEPGEGKSPNGASIQNRANILVGGRYKWRQFVAGISTYRTEIDNDAIWDGKIDDVRFYGKALSADDIKRDKDSGFPLTGFGLIAAYDFENIIGNKVSDISGHGHDADLVVVKGDRFPAADKQYTLTSKAPEAEGATLRLESSCNGLAPVGSDLTAGNDDLTYNVSNRADYRLTYSLAGVDTNLYEFLGLYVNGEKTDNAGAFLKADADATAELRFREYPRYSFELVHYDTETGETSRYPFNRNADNIYLHSLTTGHSKDNCFCGHFYVSGTLDNPEKSALADGTKYPEQIELYADPADNNKLPYEGKDVVNMAPDTEKPLFPADGNNVMFTSNNMNNEPGVGSSYAAVPTFTLVYEPAGMKTLRVSLENGGIQTGLAAVDTDLTSTPEYFTLQGIAVSSTVLTPGLYIERRGTRIAKVLVK